jgi:predicted DNA-binding protein (UPF0251 family)
MSGRIVSHPQGLPESGGAVDPPLFARGDEDRRARAEYEASLFELRVYRELSGSRDIPALRRKTHVYVQSLGFSDYSFIQMERREEPETHMYTTPKEFSDIYLSEGIYEHDQLLSYAAVNTAPIFQSTIDAYLRSAPVKTETILKNERIQRYVKGRGFLNYYNVPLHAATGHGNVLLSLTAQHVQSDELVRRAIANQKLLQILCKAVDYVGTAKFPRFFLDSASTEIKIFPKPLRLLVLLAKEDLTLNDAAASLGITRSTANAHVAAIKNAFGTRTLWGSVFKATQLGLIDKKG